MWLIGDWLNAGDREGYVERGKLDQACERFGIAYQTAKDAAWVATRFERSDRSDLLTWTHHRVVANHPQADELLDWAAESGANIARE
jgi:transposase